MCGRWKLKSVRCANSWQRKSRSRYLKKIRRYTLETIEDKYRCVKAESSGACVDGLCRALGISRSGYYAWLKRGVSRRVQSNQQIARELLRLHQRYPAMGLDSLYHILKQQYSCSRGRVHRLMKSLGIHSLRKKGIPQNHRFQPQSSDRTKSSQPPIYL